MLQSSAHYLAIPSKISLKFINALVAKCFRSSPLNCFNIFFSGPVTKIMTNARLAEYNQVAASIFGNLSKTSKGVSLWMTPKYFVATEKVHNPDGLHFAWPHTVSKVNMVTTTIFSKTNLVSIFFQFGVFACLYIFGASLKSSKH